MRTLLVELAVLLTVLQWLSPITLLVVLLVAWA